MTVFILEKLSLLNLIIVIVLRIFGFEIYYYKLSKILQSKKIIKVLRSFNVKWIDFNDKVNSVLPSYGLTQNLNVINSRKLSEIYSKKLWNGRIKKFFNKSVFLKIYIHNFLYNELFYTYGLCEFAKKVQINNSKVFFWINNNEYSKAAVKNYKNFKIIKPRFINYLSFSFDLIALIMSYFFLNKFKQKNKYRIKNGHINNIEKYKNFKNIYFLKDGIINTNSNYKDEKNFFFSKSSKDKLNSDNFIICELENYNAISLKSYEELNLDYIIFKDLVNKKTLLKDVKDCFFIFLKNFAKVDIEVLKFVLLGSLKISLNSRRLSAFKYLNNALIENEYLFPIELSIALKNKKISITCLQKRIYVPAIGHQLIIDNYFLIGRETIKHLNSQFYKKMNLRVVGGRETIGRKEKRFSQKKRSKKFKMNCAVLDYHSKKNWYQSALNPLVNWADNMGFYQDILSIAKKHPDILFTLKSKNYEWQKLEYFKKIKRKLRNQKNIEFFNMNLKLTNYQFIQNFNFFITKYTSLTDDALMNKKIVMIYENSMFISSLVEYDKKIISKNEDELNLKINLVKKNYNKYNNSLNAFRKRFYTKFDLNNFQNLLKKIFI